MRAVWFGIIFSLVTGCRSKNVTVEGGVLEETEGEYSLLFTLDSEASIAGENVGFTVFMLDADGVSTEADSFTINSDVEPALEVTDSVLIATVAGSHTMSVTATDAAGVEQSATDTLEVTGAPAAVVTVQLSADEVHAGELIDFEVSAADSYGNVLDTSAAEITVDDAVSLEGGTVSATTVGDYVITVSLDGVQGEAAWSVTPGPAANIDLILEDTFLELGDETEFSVVVTDEFGNETEDPATVGVIEPGVTVTEDEFSFESEGVFNCWAEVTGTDIMDVETVVIDSTGPSLDVWTPDRGTWTSESMVEVTGYAEDAVSDLAAIMINGEMVDELIEGEFYHEADLQFGINIFETTANDTDVDADGLPNQSSDIRSVLQSDTYWDPDLALDDGLTFRMWEGEGGLGQLEILAADLMGSVDFDSLTSGSLYDETFCFDVLWWEVCRDVILYVDDISYGDVSMDIDAKASGTMDARMTLSDLVVNFRAEGDFPSTGTVNASALHVDLSFVPSVSEAGEFLVADPVIDVPPAEGFSVDIDGSLGDIASLVGIDVEELVEDELASAIQSAVEDAVPSLLGDSLSALSFDQDFEIADNTYTLAARLQAAEVDENGLTFRMSTQVNVAEERGVGALYGPEFFPYFGYAAPVPEDEGSGTDMNLSTDMFNQLMFALWRGGMLDQELTEEELGIDMATIGLLLPGLEDLTMVTTPLLPPVLIPRADWADGYEYDLQLGGMLVQIHDGPVTDDSLALELYMAAVTPMDFATDETGAAIEMVLGDPDVSVDASYVDPAFDIADDAVESLFVGLMSVYLPELTGELGSIPLPEFEGFALRDVTTSMAGDDEPMGYWVVSGSLE
ncbi:MAG: hypothetical protein CL930_08010 [Deltaproteobacteria bacterium]|nr:hypothetical protein [Deltaproteobacteria bacterium]